MSQFDSLLDFDDVAVTTTETTLAVSTNGDGPEKVAIQDDFDPFGPSPALETKGSADDNLLGDFTTESQISESQQHNGVIEDSDPFGIGSSTVSDTADRPDDNLLFDMSSGSNPLYEFSKESAEEPANPLYEFSNSSHGHEEVIITTAVTTSHSSSHSANPLYDFIENGDEGETIRQSEEPLFSFSEHTEHTTTTSSRGLVGTGHHEDQDLFQLESQEAVYENAGVVSEPEVALESEPIFEAEPIYTACNEDSFEYREEHREVRREEPEVVETVAAQEYEERDFTRSPSSSSDEDLATKEEDSKHGDHAVGYSSGVVSHADIYENQTHSFTKGSHYGGGVSHQTEYVSSSYVSGHAGDEVGVHHDPNIARETQEKDEFHFSELSSVKHKFEEAEPGDAQPHTIDVREEYSRVEGGEYENQPEIRTDVVRESDKKNIGAELPEVGTARNIKARFSQIQADQASGAAHQKRELSPHELATGGEYISEPRGYVEKFEGRPEAGVFENIPVERSDVVKSGESLQEELPESGYAKNIASRFKQMEAQSGSAVLHVKKELTPDRSGQVEFVSEPRGKVEVYEGKAESGIFENVPKHEEDVVRSEDQAPDILPERGAAKNIAAKFRQLSETGESPVSPGGKRALTPDRSGRVEFVSEPRAHLERYEGRAESGVFENTPQGHPDVVRAEDVKEDLLPEVGHAKNVAAKFRELEKQPKSPPNSGHRKEITPPREAGVFESQPQASPDVIRNEEQLEEILPQKGTAKNMASRFRQMAEENKSPPASRGMKEFTPPRGDQVDGESGVRENQPQHRPDVVRSSDHIEEDLPERGTARNVLSKFRQMETESSKPQTPGKVKEFTPPRDEPRLSARSPRTPIGSHPDAGHVHPSELPGQYQPQVEASVFESNPESRPDVLREADTDWTEGMPSKNTTKNMVDRFRAIQAESNKEQPPPISRKKSLTVTPLKRTLSRGNAKKNFLAVQSEKCGVCQKTVYAMERLEMNKSVYHRNCFRCSQCKSTLTPKTFAVNNGTVFCTAHYKQLFARKGNYDEGFGREQHKQRWRHESTNGTDGSYHQDANS